MTDPITEAEFIRKGLTRELSTIDTDDDLSEEARTRKRKEVHEGASQRMATLRRESDDAERNEVEHLRRKAWSPIYTPGMLESDKAALRAEMSRALDRVESVDSHDQAVELLRRAVETGDPALMRAVGWRAANKGWDDVVEGYLAEASGAERRAVEAWRTAAAAYGDKDRRFRQRMQMSLMRSPV